MGIWVQGWSLPSVWQVYTGIIPKWYWYKDGIASCHTWLIGSSICVFILVPYTQVAPYNTGMTLVDSKLNNFLQVKTTHWKQVIRWWKLKTLSKTWTLAEGKNHLAKWKYPQELNMHKTLMGSNLSLHENYHSILAL